MPVKLTLPLDWEYSRNQMRHWVSDGELYDKGKIVPAGQELFVIRTSRDAYTIRKPTDVYTLFHRGQQVAQAKSVKRLKDIAALRHFEEGRK